MPKAPENLRDFAGLLKVVEFLRGPDGCPWDKEQTHESLTRYAIEEAHELAEAIDGGDVQELRDELGDLLLQVVLHSEIARQEGRFDIFDVIQNLNEKMVRRHPHVFGDVKAETASQVLSNWAEIKAAEKGQDTSKPLSFDIPQGLPALLRSQKIGEKTKKVDFDWDNAAQCWEKVREELSELEEAMGTKPTLLSDGTGALAGGSVKSRVSSSATPKLSPEQKSRIESELGDVLFSLAQFARHLELDSEQALRKCNARFEARFQRMQEAVVRDGKVWQSLSPDERERYWKAAKGPDEP